MKNLALRGLIHAVLVLAYTSGIAWIMFNGQKIFGQVDDFTGPLMILMLFVLSATIVGALVLGKPILLYLSGSKKEALKLFTFTVTWIFVMVALMFLTKALNQ